MSNPTQPVTILSATQCWEMLSSATLGRLVTCVDGRPEIFPINFAVRGRNVLFCTAEGTKLVSAVMNEQVLFEVDQHDAATGWSVIVKGVARVLRSDEELADAAQAGLLPWEAPARQHFVRIRPLSVTGRRLEFTTELAAENVPVAVDSTRGATS